MGSVKGKLWANDPGKLFGELLGLGLKWRVTECVFDKAQSQVDLQIEHTDEVWRLERCPQCGAEAKGYDRRRAEISARAAPKRRGFQLGRVFSH